MYLDQILQKYAAKDLNYYSYLINQLKILLQTWAGSCFLGIVNSGSRAKGTAISLASDVDYLISLTPDCNENNGGLKSIYESLYNMLATSYKNISKQNVSVRININGLEVDITPARKLTGNTNYHTLYVSKSDTWKQTNIQKHITDISLSRRINEIKLLKIWRELNRLDFPSIYLEYLVVNNILLYKPTEHTNLANNFIHVLNELSKDNNNPLFQKIIDPANSNNILSDLLNMTEKNKIINVAKVASSQSNWNQIVW